MVFSAWHHTTSPMARLKIMCGMVNYHTWKRVLSRQEIATLGSHSHWHACLILKAMSHAVTRDEETHYTHCFEAYLQTSNSCFTGMADAPYKLCLLWIGSQQL